MIKELKSREDVKQELIQKIGPWAFYSYNRKYWHEMSDRKIIEGAILHAPEVEKLKLLDIYKLSEIKEIWKKYIVIQSEWHHAANVWVAKNIFKASNPEGYVKKQQLKSEEDRLKKALSF